MHDAALTEQWLVPFWVRLAGPCAAVAGSFLLARLGGRIAGWLALLPLPRAAGAPWTERARVACVARGAVVMATIGTAVATTMLAPLWGRPFTPLSPALTSALAAGASLVGGAFAYRATSERLGIVRRQWRMQLRGALAMLVVQWLPILGLGLSVVVAGRTFDVRALVALALAAALFAGAHRGLGLPAARALGLLRPASPRLRRAIATATQDTASRAIAAYELPVATANALALPMAGTMVVTDGALDALDDDQLAAICSHEVGHLMEPPRARRLRLAQTCMLLPAVLIGPAIGTFGAIRGLLLAVGLMSAVLVAVRLLAARTRTLETNADHHGAHRDPATYARALERVYEVNLVPAVLRRATTHPHLYDRMLAVGVQPEYPRPAPPSLMVGLLAQTGGLTAALAGAFLLTVALVRLPAAAATWDAGRTAPYLASCPRPRADAALPSARATRPGAAVVATVDPLAPVPPPAAR